MMIGTTLGGRYKITEEVGKGGMAYVFKAHCNVLNRDVAVKVLRNDLEGGDEFVNRFNAEAQAAACLTHPNIVSIFDVGEENGLYYIVMEYIEGITLKEYIKTKGKLTSLESADIASQICGALSVAHEKNIIHRDIKPHNIMITSNNLVKVTDFGIARASNNSTMRVGDSILGSVHYISPEQARGGYVDGRSDIYSLGIVLYEMLTGKVPFESESPIAVAMKHLEETPVDPVTLSPDVSPELQEVVLKAISKETRKRYQSVDSMKSDLDTITVMLKAKTESNEHIIDEDDDIKIAGSHIVPENEQENILREETESEYQNEEIYVEEYDEYDEFDEEYSDYDDYEEEPKKRSAINMIIAAVLIALLIVGGGFFAALYIFNPDAPIFMFFKNNDVDVPDFTEMMYDDAEKLASKYGLILEIGDRQPGPAEKDVVVYQSINEGNSVKKGTHVTVHLSTGPENIDTSSYRGLSADIIDEFKEKGYDVDVKYKSSTDIDKDKIISLVQKGNKFIFMVSNGGGDIDCVVPNVLRLTKEKAREKLEENGLLLNEKVTYIESNSVEAGLVVEQSIDPGDKVSPKTKVSIILAAEKKEENKEKDEPKTDKEPDGTASDSGKDNGKGNETSAPPVSDVKEKTFHYSTEALSGPTKVKIVEKSSDGTTKTIFDQTVDPATLDEIVVKVKGSKINEYSIYHNDTFSLKTQIDFTK